jgi:hypothetical protein
MSAKKPDDAARCWVVRIGSPEKPWLADWQEDGFVWIPVTAYWLYGVPSTIVLKWRLEAL